MKAPGAKTLSTRSWVEEVVGTHEPQKVKDTEPKSKQSPGKALKWSTGSQTVCRKVAGELCCGPCAKVGVMTTMKDPDYCHHISEKIFSASPVSCLHHNVPSLGSQPYV